MRRRRAWEYGRPLILRIDHPRALPHLLWIARDAATEARLRLGAARILIKYSPAEAIPILIGFLDRPDSWQRGEAWETLHEATGAAIDYSHGPDLAIHRASADAWRRWWAEHRHEFK